jgi:hypothetical protein
MTGQTISLLVTALALSGSAAAADHEHFLSDATTGISLTHDQQWGDFGLDTAAAAKGRPGAPMRIGETVYAKGLGHHANGEIVVQLDGQFTLFRTTIGVHWQGGTRGSVVFRILVDGKLVSETGPLSDSDAAQDLEIPIQNARELRLVASDAGDGIGCDMANWANARVVRDPHALYFGPAAALLDQQNAPPASRAACGFSMIAGDTGPQIAVMQPAGMLVVSMHQDEQARCSIPIHNANKPFRVVARAGVVHGEQAEVSLSLGEEPVVHQLAGGEDVVIQSRPQCSSEPLTLELTTRSCAGETAIRWSQIRCIQGDRSFAIPFRFAAVGEQYPPPVLPNPHRAIEDAMIAWDWRMQDGIGTAREPNTWSSAIERTFRRGDRLIDDLSARNAMLGDLRQQWEELKEEWSALAKDTSAGDDSWEELWHRVHVCRRSLVFCNPMSKFGSLAFIKRVPSSFSHQLTQYYGRTSRPGGGLFVLGEPGRSMQCRQLDDLPTGSYQHLDVSWEGDRLLFAYCQATEEAADWRTDEERKYHLYEVDADGSQTRQLTDGPFDDFSPRYLPNSKLLFISTRRGGFHRCGRGPCPVYTLAVAERDGSDPRVISFHETHEWDPAVLNDGRVVYTRWDYVDRHAVHYQQLWTVRPDGTSVAAFYGNNTLNPVGVWEAQPVPQSNLVMATAAAHHAMTAGSIILLDVARGIDGLKPITRLTPDVLFPESEARVQRWHATAGIKQAPDVPVEQRRWPGHCYRTPFPLSQDCFLAAYSYDALIGEPQANPANMFGLYLVDRFGNKELLYRDPSIGSLWPMPLRARRRPPVYASIAETEHRAEGTFFLQNVYESWPRIARKNQIRQLRIIQVLPKTTPHANTPKVGLANASPGKQVLGTVPVEKDGSAYFRAPSGIPLAFQALDERGMAVQTMRSLTYLQPGEQAGCIGCHEYRTGTPDTYSPALARTREPSRIKPGPDGSKPFSYPLLVQPILDKHCVSCHGLQRAEGGIVLTGNPAGAFSTSYNTLVPLVPFSEWKGTPQANSEPTAPPDRFGARASQLTDLLRDGHEGVTLTEDEWERLVTWMDTNALFYGTFDPIAQAQQLRGERISGPALE